MAERPYVITRPFPSSGLGCNLLSMVGALYLCEQTGRNLIVDWTQMEELRDPSLNYFTAFFEPIRRWRDVDIHYVNDPQGLPCPGYDPETARQPSHREYPALFSDTHLDPRPVFLQPFHYRIFDTIGLAAGEVFRYTRSFYEQLAPLPHVRERLAAHDAAFAGRLVVGLNVRTGNGQFDDGPYRQRVNTSLFQRQSFLGRLKRACDAARARFPSWLVIDSAIFVVTDSQRMRDALLTLPGSFGARSRFPPAGAGHQFAAFDGAAYTDVDSVTETIVDMFLMARCQGLVCNYTEYNRYAQYMTMFFDGNLHNLEHYFESPARQSARWLKRRAERLLAARG